MKQMISTCPYCHSQMHISTLKCTECGTELKNDFELSPFDRLEEKQNAFLLEFLRSRGNLKQVQNTLGMSYPTAKKQLEELLIALGLTDSPEPQPAPEIDLRTMQVDRSNRRASEIIKAKLLDHGGHVTVFTARGLPCEIYANPDGTSFSSDKLPIKPPYPYTVFDVVVDLLEAQGGHARKGNGRNFRLGEPGCEENTIVGRVALSRGRRMGDSVFDPVFVLAAVLEWAGIAKNGRGELILL